MRTDQSHINICRAALIFVAGIIITSCSGKSAPDREKDVTASEVETAEGEGELQPDTDQIAEDCAAFVRSTKVVSARAASTDCPGCPAGGTPILAFRGMKMDAISCSGDTCNVVVTIRAVYNRVSGERIAGGLTGWFSPEQRSAYLSGQTPSGEQTYHVRVTYKRRGEVWRAVEFDRSPAK